MKFHYQCIVTYLLLSVDNAAAAEPPPCVGDGNRYVSKFSIDQRAEPYDNFKSQAIKLGARIELEVPKRGVIAMTLPTSESIDTMQKSAHDSGIVFEVDEPRCMSSIKPSSLKTTRKLSEDIPWGISKTYGGDIPSLDYYDNLTNKKVCVVDSGYLSNHEDLPDDEVSVNGSSYSDSGVCSYHGSHVSGTIGAIGGNEKGVIGMFPSAPGIRVAKVFKPTFFGLLCGFVYSSDLIGAVQDCQDSGADITNMSLGGTSYSSVEESTFAEFFEEGMINIAAAGNSGPNAIGYPAMYSSVISVGATDINDNIAEFSTTNSEVDISAPGVNVRSTIGPGSNYDNYDGTSMACPHVVGATLTLWNKFPSCSNQEVRSALEDGSDDLGAPGRDDQFGHGRLNYYGSLNNLADLLASGGCNSVIQTDSPSGCEDDEGSYQGKDCVWVAQDPDSRCDLCVNGNVCARDYCKQTCDSCDA